jgi:hypothetical protein
MAQEIINTGATANDGTGDPLRTAFIKTDSNFDQIWAAGPVGTNVQISGNTITTLQVNQDLVLAPNGVANVRLNNNTVPNANNIWYLGSTTNRWRGVYVGAAGLDVTGNISAAYVTVTEDLTVNGNLIVEGDVIQIGNIVTDAKTIQLANTAATDAQANGSGITVGANDDVATLLYNSTDNEWHTNIGANVAGNVTANYFIGNGSQLTGIVSTYGNANVAAYLPTYTGNLTGNSASLTNTLILGNLELYSDATGATDALIKTAGGSGADINIESSGNLYLTPDGGEVLITKQTASVDENTGALLVYGGIGVNGNINSGGNISANYFIGNGSLLTGVSSYANANAVAYGEAGWAGNIIPSGNGVYSLGNATNYWSNLWVAANTIYIGGVALGITGNTLTVDGEPVLSNDSTANVSTTGNISAGNVSVTGDITANNYVYFRGGSIIGDETDGNIFRVIAPLTYGVSIETDADIEGNNWNWTFNADGTLDTPGAVNVTGNLEANNLVVTNIAEIGDLSLAGGYITLVDGSASTGIDISPNPEGQAFLQVPNDATANTANLRVVNNAGNVTVETNAGTIWTFDSNGQLGLPDKGSLYPSADDNAGLVLLDTDSGNRAQLAAIGNVQLRSDSANSGYEWTFDTNGDLTAPGNVSANAILTDNYFYANGAPFVSSSTGNITFNNTTMSPPDGEDLFITAANSEVEITGLDFRVEVTDDVRIQGNDLVSIRNTSNVEAITIRTDYNGNDYSWEFDATGNLITPGNIEVSGDITVAGHITGTSSSSTLVLEAEPNSNTYIQLNDTVDSTISTVANLEISTDVSNTAKTWTFDTTGDLSAPGNISGTNVIVSESLIGADASPQPTISGFSTITATGNVAGGNLTTAGQIVATGNITGGNLVTGGLISATGTITGDILVSSNQSGLEGGEINLSLPAAANTTLSGNIVVIDSYGDQLRFFEDGGTTRGLYIDLVNSPAGVGAAIGYRDIPQVSFTGNATIATTDAGKHYYSTQSSNYILTIANNASQGFAVGAAISIVNQGTGNITIAQGSGVSLYLAGNATSGNRNVTTFGMATIMKVATDTWFINGTGVS